MDLFDSETYHQTPAFSDVPPPSGQAKTESWVKRPTVPRPKTFQVPHEQEVKKVACSGELTGILSREDLSLQTYQVPLDNPACDAYLDYFSRPHNRTEILSLLDKLAAYETERVKEMKRDFNPYSAVRTCSKFSRGPGITNQPTKIAYEKEVVLMANLKSLFSKLITENFALSSFDFVSIGESGGISEFVAKDYQTSNLGDVRGWAIFPKTEFVHDNVEVLPGTVSFAELEGQIASITSQTGFPTCMLIVGNLSTPVAESPSMKEKQAKLHMSLYIYAALKLLTKGGTLVFKCHNTWLPATCELLFYISRAFGNFSIVKPLACPSHSFVSSK